MDLRNRILGAAATRPAPTRAQTLKARSWLFVAATAGALGIFLFNGGVRLTGRPPLLVVLTSFGTSVIGAVGMYLLLTTRGRSMLRRPQLWLGAVAVISVAAFVAWKMSWSSAFGLTQRWPDRAGFRCLGLSLTTGVLPLFAALVAWRRTDALTPMATGAAFGAGAGLATAALVDLWCPVAYLPHLLLGHVLPILILAVLGAVIGWQVLRLRRR